MNAFIEFIPLIAFFVTAKVYGIIPATGALLVSVCLVSALHYAKNKRLTKNQWSVLVLTLLFGSLTLIFNNDVFVRYKSVVINAVFCLALLGSIVIKRPLMRLGMGNVFVLNMRGWMWLTGIWAAYFALLGLLHYYTAFYMSDDAWLAFKLYGWIPFFIAFLVGQFIFLKPYINPKLLQK